MAASNVDNDELFTDQLANESGLHGRAFGVDKLSLGYIYDFARSGALVSAYQLPSELHAAYGSHPLSSMLFLRVKL